MTPAIRALVVAPTRRELGGLRPGDGAAARVATVGIGARAAPALQRLIDEQRPVVVLSLGFGGALEPAAATADVVLCSSVRTMEGRSLDLGTDSLTPALRRAGIELAVGALLSVERPLLLQPDKWRARADSGAAVVDMEGFALAEAAREAGLPFLAVRVILDEFGEDLPDFVSTIVEDGGRHEWAHSAAALARNPLLARGMLRLAWQARRAGEAMRRVVDAVVPTLRRAEAAA